MNASPTFPRAAIATALLAALAFALTTLAGCAVGPDYRRPDAALPAQFKELPPGWTAANPADTAPRGAWWQAFGDPQLDTLMAQVDSANQDLRAAEARWRQASALGRQARAGLFPTVSLTASGSRTGGGSSSGGSIVDATGTGTVSTGGGPRNTVQFGPQISWDADLWGRVSRQVEAQNASTQASLADLANTRLSLQSELATDYFSLRVADAQRRLLDASVAAYETSLTLTRNRYAGGVATRADVATAETQWLAARAQAADIQINRQQLEHAIALLIGKAPADFTLAPQAPVFAAQPPSTVPPVADAASSPRTPAAGPGGTVRLEALSLPFEKLPLTLPPLPSVLPSNLLERRPDVASAERQVASANASIGVATAALFPSLSLSASGGWRNSGTSALSNLFEIGNRFWSLGPSLALTVFDAGSRRAAITQAEARYDETAATYRSTVLGALRDVEDQLIALTVLEREADLQAQTVRASSEALSLTVNQYRAGTVPYLNVVTAQTTDQSARRSALDITGRQLTASVALIKALGGGWQADALAAPTALNAPASAAASN